MSVNKEIMFNILKNLLYLLTKNCNTIAMLSRERIFEEQDMSFGPVSCKPSNGKINDVNLYSICLFLM